LGNGAIGSSATYVYKIKVKAVVIG